MEALFNLFSVLGDHIALLLISMFPLVELRGAILLGAALNMPMGSVFLTSVIGNLIPVPFLILFARKILTLLKKIPCLQNLVHSYERTILIKAESMKSLTFWGLAIFVAIPLPGTGAWTGAFLAAFLNMAFKKALPAITIGVLIAGCIMTAASYGLIGLFSFLT